MPSTRVFGVVLIGLLVTAPVGAQSARTLVTSIVNGRSIKVFATGSGTPRVTMSQVNATAQIRFDGHEIFVADDGRITVDGIERSQGLYKDLEVFIGDHDSIDLKVTR